MPVSGAITQTLASFSQSATGAVVDYYGTGILGGYTTAYLGGTFTPLPHSTVHFGAAHAVFCPW